jgi:hypothetical protein
MHIANWYRPAVSSFYSQRQSIDVSRLAYDHERQKERERTKEQKAVANSRSIHAKCLPEKDQINAHASHYIPACLCDLEIKWRCSICASRLSFLLKNLGQPSTRQQYERGGAICIDSTWREGSTFSVEWFFVGTALPLAHKVGTFSR